MTDSKISEGYRVWHNEVEWRQLPHSMTPYIPMIGLVGVCAALTHDSDKLTSYHWRQSVLENDDALDGMRMSLPVTQSDNLDDDWEYEIANLEPEKWAAKQHRYAYRSITDGVPEGVTTITERERFLATALGHGMHDHTFALGPLRLYDLGASAFVNFYPATARFVERSQVENSRY